MARAFAMIDALPRREQDVYEALAKVPAVVSRRLLTQRVGQGDILVLLEAADNTALEKVFTNELRSVQWVHNIIRIQPHHTLMGPVQKLMGEMYAEADAKKPR